KVRSQHWVPGLGGAFPLFPRGLEITADRLAMVPRPPTDLADRPVFLEVQVSDILLSDHPEHPFWLPPSPRTSGAWVDRGGPLFLHHRPSDWDTFRVAFTLGACNRSGSPAASMGPPLFRGGHPVILWQCIGTAEASMGPPLFRGGHPVRAVTNAVAGRASMGPPLFRGGHDVLDPDNAGLDRASMGPPLFRGGHLRRGCWHRGIGVASMGPPLFRG